MRELAEDESLSSDKWGEYSEEESIYEDKENMLYNDETNVHAYFADMAQLQHDNLGCTEYLHAVYDLSSTKKNEEKCLDTIINLSDFVPKPKSLSQVIRLNGIIKEKWEMLLEKKLTVSLTMVPF